MTTTYSRFRIGEEVHVLTTTGTHHLRQTIRGRITVNGHDHWLTDMGWFADHLVLAPDEYRDRQGGDK